MQDTLQKAKQAMPELARMMWTDYAVHTLILRLGLLIKGVLAVMFDIALVPQD